MNLSRSDTALLSYNGTGYTGLLTPEEWCSSHSKHVYGIAYVIQQPSIENHLQWEPIHPQEKPILNEMDAPPAANAPQAAH